MSEDNKNNNDINKIVDKRNHNFTMIDNEIFDYKLDSNTFYIYYYILRLSYHNNNGDRNNCFPSLRSICSSVNLSRNTVLKCIEILEDKKLIAVERSGGYWTENKNTGRKEYRNAVNTYSILPVAKIEKKEACQNLTIPSSNNEPPPVQNLTEPSSSNDIPQFNSCKTPVHQMNRNNTSENKTSEKHTSEENINTPTQKSSTTKNDTATTDTSELNEFHAFEIAIVFYAQSCGRLVNTLSQCLQGQPHVRVEKENQIKLAFENRKYDWKHSIENAKSHAQKNTNDVRFRFHNFIERLIQNLNHGDGSNIPVYKNPKVVDIQKQKELERQKKLREIELLEEREREEAVKREYENYKASGGELSFEGWQDEEEKKVRAMLQGLKEVFSTGASNDNWRCFTDVGDD